TGAGQLSDRGAHPTARMATIVLGGSFDERRTCRSFHWPPDFVERSTANHFSRGAFQHATTETAVFTSRLLALLGCGRRRLLGRGRRPAQSERLAERATPNRCVRRQRQGPQRRRERLALRQDLR